MLESSDEAESFDGMRKRSQMATFLGSGSLRQYCWKMSSGNVYGESSNSCGLQPPPETKQEKARNSLFRFIHRIQSFGSFTSRLKAFAVSRRKRKDGGDCLEEIQQTVPVVVAGTSAETNTRQAKSCGYIEHKSTFHLPKLKKWKEQRDVLGKSESEPLKKFEEVENEVIPRRNEREKNRSFFIYCCFYKKRIEADDDVIEICLCPSEDSKQKKGDPLCCVCGKQKKPKKKKAKEKKPKEKKRKEKKPPKPKKESSGGCCKKKPKKEQSTLCLCEPRDEGKKKPQKTKSKPDTEKKKSSSGLCCKKSKSRQKCVCDKKSSKVLESSTKKSKTKIKSSPKVKATKTDVPEKKKSSLLCCKKSKSKQKCLCDKESSKVLESSTKKSKTKIKSSPKVKAPKTDVPEKKKSSLLCCKKSKSKTEVPPEKMVSGVQPALKDLGGDSKDDLLRKQDYRYDITLPEAVQRESNTFDLIATLLRQIYQEMCSPPFKGEPSQTTLNEVELLRTDDLAEEYQTTVYAIRKRLQEPDSRVASGSQKPHSLLTINSGELRMQVKSDEATNWFNGRVGNLEITIDEKPGQQRKTLSAKSNNTDPMSLRTCSCHCFLDSWDGAFDTYCQTNDSYLNKILPTKLSRAKRSLSNISLKSKSLKSSTGKLQATKVKLKSESGPPTLKRYAAVDVYKKLVGVEGMSDDDPRKYIVKIHFDPKNGCCATKSLMPKTDNEFQECGCNWGRSQSAISLKDVSVAAVEPPKRKASAIVQANRKRKSSMSTCPRKDTCPYQSGTAQTSAKRSRSSFIKRNTCPAKNTCPHKQQLRKQASRSTFPTHRSSSSRLSFKHGLNISKIICPYRTIKKTLCVTESDELSLEQDECVTESDMWFENKPSILKTVSSQNNQNKKVKMCVPSTDVSIQRSPKQNTMLQHPEMLDEKTQTQKKKAAKKEPQYCFG